MKSNTGKMEAAKMESAKMEAAKMKSAKQRRYREDGSSEEDTNRGRRSREVGADDGGRTEEQVSIVVPYWAGRYKEEMEQGLSHIDQSRKTKG